MYIILKYVKMSQLAVEKSENIYKKNCVKESELEKKEKSGKNVRTLLSRVSKNRPRTTTSDPGGCFPISSLYSLSGIPAYCQYELHTEHVLCSPLRIFFLKMKRSRINLDLYYIGLPVS